MTNWIVFIIGQFWREMTKKEDPNFRFTTIWYRRTWDKEKTVGWLMPYKIRFSYQARKRTFSKKFIAHTAMVTYFFGLRIDHYWGSEIRERRIVKPEFKRFSKSH